MPNGITKSKTKHHQQGTSSLITTTWGLNNVQFVRLDAQQWSNWLERYRAGEDPVELTKELLGSNWLKQE